MKRKLLSCFTVFLVSLIVTVSCTPSQPTSTSLTSTTTPIQIGYSAWPGCVPLQVTQQKNIFDREKINVDLRWFDDYLASLNSLNSGSLDVNCQALNETITAVENNSKQVVVLVTDNSTGNDAIIASEGITSMDDLKGKKVAAELGTLQHFLLLLSLKKAGMTPADIQLEPLASQEAAEAFLAGHVDAVATFTPFTTKVLLRPGSKVLISSKDFPGAIPSHLVVSRQLINERPKDVQALVNSWFATLDFIRNHPEETYNIMAERAGVSVEEYKTYDAGIKIFNIEENLKAFSPGNDMTSLSYAAEDISKFLLENGLIKKEPDMSKIFDDRFVKAYAASLRS